jgi:hypothetical protein
MKRTAVEQYFDLEAQVAEEEEEEEDFDEDPMGMTFRCCPINHR